MALSPSLTLTGAEKLEALRRLDQFRQWRSLDEKRYCLVCGKIIIGRQIQVAAGTRGNGPLRLNCPTERCISIPMDWVPTEEILANVEMRAVEERKAAPSTQAHCGDGEPERCRMERLETEQKVVASRFRDFVLHSARGS